MSTTAKLLANVLTQEFKYEVAPIIKLSDFIRAEAYRVELANVPLKPLNAYVTHMQDAGNKLREKFGNNYLAEKAVERIAKFRRDNGGYRSDNTFTWSASVHH